MIFDALDAKALVIAAVSSVTPLPVAPKSLTLIVSLNLEVRLRAIAPVPLAKNCKLLVALVAVLAPVPPPLICNGFVKPKDEAFKLVKIPVEGVVAPIGLPLMEPPVMT